MDAIEYGHKPERQAKHFCTKVLLLCLLFLWIVYPATSQTPEIQPLPAENAPLRPLRFQHYTNADGLSHYIGFHEGLIQDSTGFIWSASMNGLNRFDGREFRVFRYKSGQPNTLTSNEIATIREASGGRLWIGTGGKGLNIFDPETETFDYLFHGPNDPESLCGNDIRSIHRDRSGRMWVNTLDGGLCRCGEKGRRFQRYPGVGGASFLQTQNGDIWTGGSKGLYHYDPERDSFLHFIPFPNEGADWNNVWSMAEGPDGEIWLTSRRKGQRIFDPQTKTFRDLPPQLVRGDRAASKFFSDRHRHLWIGMAQSIARYNPFEGTVELFAHSPMDPTSCRKTNIIDMIQDREGSLWMRGYLSGGLSVVRTLQNPFQVLPGWGSDITDMGEGRVLVSTASGFALFDSRQGRFLPGALPPALQTAKGNVVRFSRPHKTLWWRDHRQQKIFGYHFPSGQIKKLDYNSLIRLGPEGNLWFANSYACYDVGKDTVINYHKRLLAADTAGVLPGAGLLPESMALDSSGHLWMGSRSGTLLRFDPATDKLRIFQPSPGGAGSLSKSRIYCILPASDGRVYLTTETEMYVYLPSEDRFLHLEGSINISDNTYMPMIEDLRGDIWVVTSNGVSRLDTKKLTFQHFTKEDGVPDGYFHSWITCRDDEGYLYFSRRGSIHRFHPDSVRPYQGVAPVVLTNFYINRERVVPGVQPSLLDKAVQYQERLVLNHHQSDFGFRFVSLNFYKSEKIQYFYQLENYHKDWIPLGNRLEVHLTNIPAGHYRFKVKARTEAGLWTKEATSIAIKVLPPWWEAWWAYMLYGVLTLAFIYRVYRFMLSRRLAQAEAFRLKELDELKTKLYTNITHEFRTPLTVIQGMADQIGNNPKEARRLIRRNSKNLLHLVTQMLDMSKIESNKMDMHWVQGNIISYLRYLTQSFQSYAQAKKTQLVFEAGPPEIMMDYEPEKLQHIIANLLSNAIKFTHEGGHVSIHVNEVTDHLPLAKTTSPILRIIVRDDGIGIKEEHLPHIFDRFYQADGSTTRRGDGTGIGLALARELTELMNGVIKVKSELGHGTEFKILLPIRQTADLLDNSKGPGTGSGLMPYFPSIHAAKKSRAPSDPSDSQPIQDQPITDPSNLPLLLIIEDNPDVVIYIRGCLAPLYNVQVAENGKTGIEKALELIPDIIISDVMMPEKDGFEVTQTLKKDERTSHIPIILLTAKADMDSRLEGLERGADAYLAKPFDKKELLIRLEKLVELRRKMQVRYGQLAPLPPTPDVDLQVEDAFLKKIREAVEAHISDVEFTVVRLCREVGMSQPQLYRKIKALTGRSTAAYMRSLRLQKGKILLETTDLNVSEVAFEVGFSNPFYFSNTFSKEFGRSPSDMRKS